MNMVKNRYGDKVFQTKIRENIAIAEMPLSGQTDLFLLAWQVRTLSWNDLWFSLDPEGWANVMSGKNIIGGIVAEWKQGYLLKW